MRKSLKRLLPSPRELRQHHGLRRFFGTLLHEPDLWHLNRNSVAWSVSVGLFMAFMPFPLQMVAAAAAAIAIGCNLPIAVTLVWITNPLTFVPIFYGMYLVGAWLLGVHPEPMKFQMSPDWFFARLETIWAPLIVGCLFVATVTGALGQIVVRLIWRIHIITRWRERGQLRASRALLRRSSPDGSDDRIDDSVPRDRADTPGQGRVSARAQSDD